MWMWAGVEVSVDVFLPHCSAMKFDIIYNRILREISLLSTLLLVLFPFFLQTRHISLYHVIEVLTTSYNGLVPFTEKDDSTAPRLIPDFNRRKSRLFGR